MKKSLKVLALPAAAMFLLTGCSDKDEVKEPTVTDNTDQTENNTGNEESTKTTSTISFQDFNLDVEYLVDEKNKKYKEYNAEYDSEKNQTEASIKDELKDTHLHGDEAMDELLPKLEKLTFTKDTSEEEVFSEVTKVFNLDEDYDKLEIDVTFEDGTEREYMKKK